MFLTNQAAIRDVLLFPHVRPEDEQPLFGVSRLPALAAQGAEGPDGELPQKIFSIWATPLRLPYGTKTAATVERYALQAVAELVRHGVKAVVLQHAPACCVCRHWLQAHPDLPVDRRDRAGRSRCDILLNDRAYCRPGYRGHGARWLPARNPRALPQAGAPPFLPRCSWHWPKKDGRMGDVAIAAARRYLAPLFGAGVTCTRCAGTWLHAFSADDRCHPRGGAAARCVPSTPQSPPLKRWPSCWRPQDLRELAQGGAPSGDGRWRKALCPRWAGVSRKLASIPQSSSASISRFRLPCRAWRAA